MPSFRLSSRLLSVGLSVGLLLGALAGCGSAPTKAPVEDRKPAKSQAGASAASAGKAVTGTPPVVAVDTPKALPGAENAGRAGYYTVKPGDTMIRIGLENGQNWRDVVRWNGIENPNLIEVGQVLRVVPPGVDPAAVASRGVAAAQVDARPLEGKGASLPAALPASGALAPGAEPGKAAASAPPVAPAAAGGSDDEPAWAWPASGPVVAGFEEGKQKGLLLSGKPGDAVLAAADGRVVYAGAGLRGYGNLLIVKHNNTYLTAYAHNQSLLVKEDQAVRRGQKIAEMGSSDAERVQLHFEIRRQGKPIDPARLLPAR